jgi:metal-responsive CopG/Arc/MetJ family transcriptional regulator
MAASAGLVIGYTRGMKTAVSIPDEVFEKVERLAKRGRRSRSEVFTAALREYVARHSPDEVTEAINRVCEDVDQTEDVKFLNAAARRLLKKVEW